MNEIVVVGNGPSLLDKYNGKKINSFRNVLRFNYFTTLNYERYVGEKTTMWFTGTGYEPDNWRNKLNYDRIFLFSWQKDLDICKPYLKFKENITQCPVEFVDHKYILDIQDYMKNKKYTTYSSGAICIQLLLNLYDQITITGFDWWEKRSQHHYYSKSGTLGPLHDPNIEKEYIFKLVSENKIVFL
jgi:hypothetical protein